MLRERRPMYGLIVHGEWDCLDENLEVIMDRAKQWVEEKINNFHRHDLPIKVTPEVAWELDVYAYKLTSENEVELPLQAWFDEYYADMKQGEVDDEEREWKRYLELAEKFRDRIAKEAS